ncbi:MAG: asparagine--tRNA ligase [Candidatus Aenigmatarchaeota archaeon]
MFVPISDVPKYRGKEVSLRGWVYRKREQKEIVFIILRDSSGIIQLACKGIPEAEKATIESSVTVRGSVKEDKRAPGGYEIQAKELGIIGLAERFPIGRDLSEEFLRDVRHLWIRSRKLTEIMKVRSEVFRAIHDFCRSRRCHEVQSPIFTKSACETGAELFEVKKYGDKKGVYLSLSWQLYAEAMIQALERIYTITPAFRAEKSRTVRHLSEYWTAEVELAWVGYEEIIKFQEDMILHIVKHVLKHCKKELKELGRDTTDLEQLTAPFKRIMYADAIKKLGLKWGHDLTDKEERELMEKIGAKAPVFLERFPREMKAFYMEPDPKDPKVVLGADLLVPRVGEIIGGSERIYDKEKLLESLKLFKLPKKDYEWYIDLRRYGTVPHSGFGLGIERLVMWLTGAPHIFDTIAFPRTLDRVTP